MRKFSKTIGIVLTLLLSTFTPNIPAYADTAPSTNTVMNLQWINSIGGSNGDFFNDVEQTKDNGYVAVGYTYSTDGDMVGKAHGCDDAIIAKFDASGKEQWLKVVGGIDEDIFKSVQQTVDGGYIAVGQSDSNTGDFKGFNKGKDDGVIVKFTSTGDIQWIDSIGGSGNDTIYSIQKTANNNFLVMGTTNSTDKDMEYTPYQNGSNFVADVNIFGIIEWKKYIPTADNTEQINSIRQTSDNGYIVSGYIRENLVGSQETSEAFVEKMDSSSDVQWISYFCGTGTDKFYSAQPTSDGGYIAVGESNSTDGDLIGIHKGSFDAIIVKYDKNGKREWVKTAGGSNDDGFYSVQETSDGGYVAAGYSGSINGDLSGIDKSIMDGSDAFIVKFDKNGYKEWVKDIGGSRNDIIDSISSTNDNGYIAVGYSDSNINMNRGNYDAIIMKLNNSDPVTLQAPWFSEKKLGNESVVSVTFPKNAFDEQYKVGDTGDWKDYNGPIIVSNNCTIYARYSDVSKTPSDTGKITISDLLTVLSVR